jgi:RNA polymerase sigma factor (sigma-70 family)
MTIKDPSLQDALLDLMKTIDEREAEVLVLHFFEGLEYSEISKDMGFSRSRAHQIAQDALRKLRYPTRVAKIRDFAQGFKNPSAI